SLGVQLSEKLDGLLIAPATAVVEIEELQGVIAEGQDKGFLAAETLDSALEGAELSPQQTQDLFSFLEEHGIDVIGPSEAASELHAHGAVADGRAPSGARERITGEAGEVPLGGEEDEAGGRARRGARGGARRGGGGGGGGGGGRGRRVSATSRSRACRHALRSSSGPRSTSRSSRASTRCGCTCARSGGCRCSAPRRRSRWPSASSAVTSRPSSTWSRPTCGWWCPSPRAMSGGGSRCSTSSRRAPSG